MQAQKYLGSHILLYFRRHIAMFLYKKESWLVTLAQFLAIAQNLFTEVVMPKHC